MAESGDPWMLIPASSEGEPPLEQEEDRTVADPGKVARLATMAHVLLDEANRLELDEAARERFADIYERSVDALSEVLSEDLQVEVVRLGMGGFSISDGPPTTPELRIAQAQLVGWLEGLFHGIGATLTRQHFAQQEKLARLYADALRSAPEQEDRRLAGTYL